MGYRQISRKIKISAEICENRKRTGDHDRRHDCKPVESVGKIDGIARADNNKISQRDEKPVQFNGNGFEKRHDKLRFHRVLCGQIQCQRSDQAGAGLPEVFSFCREAMTVF